MNPVFAVRNYHRSEAPALSQNDHVYRGYFENCHGEQMVFEYSYDELVGKLYVGDADWKLFPVVGGHADGLVMELAERTWLMACWDAATRCDEHSESPLREAERGGVAVIPNDPRRGPDRPDEPGGVDEP